MTKSTPEVDSATMTTNKPNTSPHTDHQPPQRGRFGHGWMMIACCIPMLAIAVALVIAGVISGGFLLFAIGCTAMMALMMRGMSNGDSHSH